MPFVIFPPQKHVLFWFYITENHWFCITFTSLWCIPFENVNAIDNESPFPVEIVLHLSTQGRGNAKMSPYIWSKENFYRQTSSSSFPPFGDASHSGVAFMSRCGGPPCGAQRHFKQPDLLRTRVMVLQDGCPDCASMGSRAVVRDWTVLFNYRFYFIYLFLLINNLNLLYSLWKSSIRASTRTAVQDRLAQTTVLPDIIMHIVHLCLRYPTFFGRESNFLQFTRGSAERRSYTTLQHCLCSTPVT